MQLVEMMVVMGKDRMIQLPEEEVKVMGLSCVCLIWWMIGWRGR